MFENAKWIWQGNGEKADEYCRFIQEFSLDGTEGVVMYIACEYNYTVWINGMSAGFGQYPGFKHCKYYDALPLDGLLKRGVNKAAVEVWHQGLDCFTEVRDKAGLIFEIQSAGRTVAASSENTLSRISPDYRNYKCELITFQLGYSFGYDMTAYDGWNKADYLPNGFSKSSLVSLTDNIIPRPNKKLVMGGRVPVRLAQQGSYIDSGGETLAKKLQRMPMSYIPLREMLVQGSRELPATLKCSENSGIYIIIDCLEEQAGLLELDIEVQEKCEIRICYGEHLDDGRVRSAIGDRSFVFEYTAAAGKQSYINYYRRLGARYIGLFISSHTVTLNYVGIRPTNYPVTVLPYNATGILRQKIYDTAVRTLQLCMHEHYEDCPWREQALYSMDSRNQMLCGYYAFGEYQMPRSALLLMAQGAEPGRLMYMCSPSVIGKKIPSFNLTYLIQVNEYIKFSKDKGLFSETVGAMENIIEIFLKNRGADGLIREFRGEWNFYEWSETLSGNLPAYQGGGQTEQGEGLDRASALINALFVIAVDNFREAAEAVGRNYQHLKDITDNIKELIYKHFFNEKEGLFESYEDCCRGRFCALTNSLCILAGAVERQQAISIIEAIVARPDIIECTLSMKAFYYDAMLQTDRERYRGFVLADLDEDYFKMLRGGATSFWERIDGSEAFSRAGSLCHGWSALPVLYYRTLDN